MSRELPLDGRTEELRPVEQQMVHHLVGYGWKDVVYRGMSEGDDLLDSCDLGVFEELSVLQSRDRHLRPDRLAPLATADRLVLLNKDGLCEQLPGVRQQDQRALVPVRVAHAVERVDRYFGGRLRCIEQEEILPTTARGHSWSPAGSRRGTSRPPCWSAAPARRVIHRAERSMSEAFSTAPSVPTVGTPCGRGGGRDGAISSIRTAVGIRLIGT